MRRLLTLTDLWLGVIGAGAGETEETEGRGASLEEEAGEEREGGGRSCYLRMMRKISGVRRRKILG